jgi:hypothetical protein
MNPKETKLTYELRDFNGGENLDFLRFIMPCNFAGGYKFIL